MNRFLLLSAFAPIFAASAVAQDAQDTPLIEDTVIVTAPGPARSADELIGAASAVERAELIESLTPSLGDTLDELPGVASSSFGIAASRPVLRGLGAERVLILTNGVGVIDVSAASPDHQVATDGIDADKIEVLRGPAALAYGGQAIGGVVNVIDGLIAEEAPEGPISGDIFAAWDGSADGTEAGAKVEAAAGPLVFNLSASMRDFDAYNIPGFAESAGQRALEEAEHDDEEHHDEEEGEEHDEEHEGEEHGHDEEEEAFGEVPNSQLETQTLSGGASWVTDSGFFGVAVRQQTAEYGLPGHSHGHEDEHGHGEEEGEEHGDEEDHEGEEEHGEEEEAPFIDLEQLRIDVRTAWDLNAGIFTRFEGSAVFADYEHTEFEAPDEAGTLYENDGWEGRFDVTTQIGEWQGAVGMLYLDKEIGAFGAESFLTTTTNETLGAFVYQSREWESGFGVEGGLRFEQVEYENVDQGTADFDNVSGSLAAHRHWETGLFVGGQLSLTQRAPNETELFINGAHLATSQFEIGDPTLDQETGLNLEGTARWSANNWSLGANIFYTDYSDFIALLASEALNEDGVLVDELDELPVFRFLQEDAEFTGGEIYGQLVVPDVADVDYTFKGSIDYVDAELDSGGAVPYVPPLAINFDAKADWGLVDVALSVTYEAEQDDVPDGILPADSYTIVDLTAGVNINEFTSANIPARLFLSLRNIGDEEGRPATSVIKDLAPLPGAHAKAGLRLTF